MKDSEFYELLNLYLDHEISAADAARLEAEVQADPERRHVYHDYCRMQKACSILAKDFADQLVSRKVVTFEPQRSNWGPGLFALGGLAAAACVALVLINRTPNTVLPGASTASVSASVATTATTAGSAAMPMSATTAPSAVATSAPVAPAPISMQADPAQQVANVTPPAAPQPKNEASALLTSMPLHLSGGNAINADAMLVVAQQNAQAQLEWIKNMQLAPIQQLPLDDPRLDARSQLQPGSRTYSSTRPPVQGNVEWAAFKFQR